MQLFPIRKGTGNGRVLPLDSIKNSQGSIMNKYVPGAGVGATSRFARRAMLRRATENGSCPACCSQKI
jgi:hypothetical protein